MEKLLTIVNRIHTTAVERLKPNNPEYIIIHSTRKHQTFEDVYDLHVNGRGWDGVGYHYFISAANGLYQARPLDREGAHALGFNFKSIAMCIFGRDESTDPERIEIGKEIIEGIKGIYGELPVISHTQAQAIYNNKGFEMNGIDYKFTESPNITNPEIFEGEKAEAIRILESKRSPDRLKKQIRNFKNCPGIWFPELLD